MSRYSGIPEPPKSPLELLTRRDDHHEDYSFFTLHGMTVAGAVIGVAMGFLQNIYTKRPYFSGVQKHVIFGIIGGIIGKLGTEHRIKGWAQRDAMYRQYVELHPEDFPPYDRKTYGQLFQKWYPVR